MTNYRQIDRIVTAKQTVFGAGFKSYDIEQQQLGRVVQPFLQMANYYMTQPTFREHPHQGFSAVTYMFEDSEGSFFNEDSQGDLSMIAPGDLHWTQAGSGIRHNETPIEPGKICHGIQMFVDLPAADKLLSGKAYHLSAAQIPTYTTDAGVRVRVVVGSANGVTSPLNISTKIRFLDVIMPANSTIEHEVTADESVFLYAIKGSGSVGSDRQSFQVPEAIVFDLNGDRVAIHAGAEGLQYILAIGYPD